MVPAKGDCSRREILPVEGLLPRGPPTLNAAAEAHKAQAYLPKASRGVGQRILPRSQAAQLWNQCRPLMFLWLPNANSGVLGKTFMASSRTVSPDQASAVHFARGRPQRRQE